MMKALIVVDVQNDFLPGGSLAVAGGDAVIDGVNALIDSGRFDAVVLTQDWHPVGHVSFASSHAGKNPFEAVEVAYGTQALWPDHCMAGTSGAAFSDRLHADAAQVVIRKGTGRDCDSYSGFMEADRQTRTGLAGWLRERGISEVCVCGLATDFCVAWTAIDAAGAGFVTQVVTDASAAIDVGGSLAQATKSWRAVGVTETTVAQLLA